MSKYYSREQLKQLKELDVIKHFNSVLNSQYKRGTNKQTDLKVAEIYEQATSTKISKNFGCKICVFNLYRDAGKLYFESEKYWKQESMRKAREAKKLKEQQKQEEKENGQN